MDTTTNNTDSQEDTYPNAGRDSGYVAPVGEDLVNRLTVLLSTIETKLLVQGQQTRTDIAALAKQQIETEHRQKQLEDEAHGRAAYFYKHFGDFLKDADSRFTGYDGALTTVLEEVRGLGGLVTRVDTIEAGVAELTGQVEDLGTGLDDLAKRVGIVEATPGTYPDLLRGMQRLEKMVTETGRLSERRQLYLLIAIGSIILLFAVLVALQIARG